MISWKRLNDVEVASKAASYIRRGVPPKLLAPYFPQLSLPTLGGWWHDLYGERPPSGGLPSPENLLRPTNRAAFDAFAVAYYICCPNHDFTVWDYRSTDSLDIILESIHLMQMYTLNRIPFLQGWVIARALAHGQLAYGACTDGLLYLCLPSNRRHKVDACPYCRLPPPARDPFLGDRIARHYAAGLHWTQGAAAGNARRLWSIRRQLSESASHQPKPLVANGR